MDATLLGLSPEVYTRAADLVLKAEKGGNDSYACIAIYHASGWTSRHKDAFVSYFGPRNRKGLPVNRDGYWQRNIKFAPRPVRNHPFWDRNDAQPERQQDRAMALLMMAAIVREANNSQE